MSEIQKLPINPKVPLEERAWAERLRVGHPATVAVGAQWKAASVTAWEKTDDGLITSITVIVHEPGPASFITRVPNAGETLRFTWRATAARFALEGGPAVGQGYSLSLGRRDDDRIVPTKRQRRAAASEKTTANPNDVV